MVKKIFFSFAILFILFFNISFAYVIDADFESGDFDSLTGGDTSPIYGGEEGDLGAYFGKGVYWDAEIVQSPAIGDYAVALKIGSGSTTAAYLFTYATPTTQKAYYSASYYIPDNIEPDSWWNVWQWKSSDNTYSKPIFDINFIEDEGMLQARISYVPEGLKTNPTQFFSQENPIPIPRNQWVTFIGEYVSKTSGGSMKIYQDGVLFFEKNNINTRPGNKKVFWSVNSYADKISPNPATIYVDDMIISETPLDECVPDCSGKQCGDDNCGNSCGTCQDNYNCISNQCVIRDCTSSDWIYSDGECQSNNKLTRTWTKTSTCENEISHPNTEQKSCTYVPFCTEDNWEYVDGECQSNNKLIRTWTKTSTCGNGVSHPDIEFISCIYQESELEENIIVEINSTIENNESDIEDIVEENKDKSDSSNSKKINKNSTPTYPVIQEEEQETKNNTQVIETNETKDENNLKLENNTIIDSEQDFAELEYDFFVEGYELTEIKNLESEQGLLYEYTYKKDNKTKIITSSIEKSENKSIILNHDSEPLFMLMISIIGMILFSYAVHFILKKII